jgi:hypothetical protein
MSLGDLFKKGTEPGSTEPDGTTKEEGQQDQVTDLPATDPLEEDFEAKSARLLAELEEARAGRDLGDIPAHGLDPYHLKLNEHRQHEALRKR